MTTQQPEALRDARWYMVNKDGMATLCTDRADAEKEAEDAQSVWPHMGPHRAVQLVDVASVAVSAESEPVAWRELCRRLYVELYYCNQQMTGGKRPKWQQGKTVRDVLADAKAALDAAPQPSPASQGDALDAARYRYLRDGDWREHEKLESVIRLQLNTLWDETIDAARAAQEGSSHG